MLFCDHSALYYLPGFPNKTLTGNATFVRLAKTDVPHPFFVRSLDL
jgi:hypothetical protein